VVNSKVDSIWGVMRKEEKAIMRQVENYWGSKTKSEGRFDKDSIFGKSVIERH
jgi:hypothetical protein